MIRALVLSTCIALGVSSTAVAQDAAEAFAPLRKQVRTLADTLLNLRGMSEDDAPYIEALRGEVAAFNDAHPDYVPAIASELQLSLWLEDGDAAARLYGKLRELLPGNLDIALSWAEHLQSNNMYPELLDAYATIQYDPTVDIMLGILHAETLLADHQFQAAIDVLETLETEDQQLNFRITQSLTHYADALDRWDQEVLIRETEATKDDNPRCVIDTSRGPVTVELFEDDAPNTVANFIKLAEEGFYEGTKFHRVLPGFMAQGGDPNSKEGSEIPPGIGDAGYKIRDEHIGSAYRRHYTGALAMANTGGPNSGGSQFYITVLPAPHANGGYTVFGRVIEGIENVRAIKQDDEILSVAVLRKRDHEYEPEIISLGDLTGPLPPQGPTVGDASENATEDTEGETEGDDSGETEGDDDAGGAENAEGGEAGGEAGGDGG